MSSKYSRIYAEIDMDAIAENFRKMREKINPETKMAAVIKTDGYGHGAVPIAHMMEKEDYISFIAGLVEQTGETEGSLILNDADREKIGRDLIRHLNEYIDGGNFVMHDKTKAIRGGFILVKGPVSINCTIENLVDEAREELTGKAAEQLFR